MPLWNESTSILPLDAFLKPKYACAVRPEVLKCWSLEMDYSRASCPGADQKTRGLWERGWILWDFKDVRAYCYCASLLPRKFTRNVVYRVRALRNIKTNNDGEDGHCYSFAWILRSWTFGYPFFLFSETDFIYNELHIVQK